MSRPAAHPDRFLERLRPFQRPLEVYCRRQLLDPSEAEDALQAAVLAAFGRADRFAEGTNFRAWIFRFVTLEVMARNRQRRGRPEALGDAGADLAAREATGWDDDDEVVDRLVDDPNSGLTLFEGPLAHALRGLASSERTVLLLRAIGELGAAEIHEVTGIAPGSVMGYLARARRKMKQALLDQADQTAPRRQNEEPRR